MIYEVNNVGTYYKEHQFIVIRDCRNDKFSPGFWFYGAYDNVTIASRACTEIRNGIIVSPDQIKVISYGTW